MNTLLNQYAEEVTTLPIGMSKRIKAFIKKHNINPDSPIQINLGEYCRKPRQFNQFVKGR